MTKILIADDEKNIRHVLKTELRDSGHDVSEAASGLEALQQIEKSDFDVLLLDLNMPGRSGFDVLKSVSAMDSPPETVVLTADASVSTAVEAMRLGAYDYIIKPFKLDELSVVIEKAFEKKRLRSENILLKTQIKRESEEKKLIAQGKAMTSLLEVVRKVAKSDFPVLITGESGSGKELIARTIYSESARADGPFVAINCGAIPESMIESELFGYEKGAFTGAQSRKPGLLEVANNGTLFLDEIGDMPLPLQVKLLRVIETGSFFRLGGTRELKVDVRIVSATNKDLKSDMEKGIFRQDLYYRISALTVSVPPLRERPEDIPPLIEHFISAAAGLRKKRFSEEALKILCGYSWPGNVRELQHVVHRALLLSKSDVIGPSDLSTDLVQQKSSTGSQKLADIEREHILKTLKECAGQRGRAAEALGIDPKTLYRKLTEYGVKETL